MTPVSSGVAPTAEPSGYYGPGGLFQLKGAPTVAKIPSAAKDQAVAKRLWAQAERLTGATFASLVSPPRTPNQSTMA